MNAQEALKLCLRVLRPISENRVYETRWLQDAIDAAEEALESQEQEPEVTAMQILKEFPLLDDGGLDEEEHHCEWTLQQDRKRLHAMLNTNTAPSQEQEPVKQRVKVLYEKDGIQTCEILPDTHPAQPLSYETVRAEFRSYVDNNLDVDDGFRFVDFLEGVRYAEKAHGIV